MQNRIIANGILLRQLRRGFTIIELLVTMGIIAILVSLLLPAVQQARTAALRTQCISHLRNVSLAVVNSTEQFDRFPASGSFGEKGNHHNWVLDTLPWLDQKSIADRWNTDKRLTDPGNAALASIHIAVLTCPSDISVVGMGDLSFVVNGGVGFTSFFNSVHDCPIDPGSNMLDLNGNGVACPPNDATDGTPSDKDYFFRLGLFFCETWKWNVSPPRHHRWATVLDGLSQTVLLSENIRTGYDPERPGTNWASPNPYLTSFFIGNPCANANCKSGNVDYKRANAGNSAINSGLASPEGTSPVPNSLHGGGVNMAYCDGHVSFMSQTIDGGVYAALVSPEGLRLNGTPLAQSAVSVDY